jgi:hypothetical protein
LELSISGILQGMDTGNANKFAMSPTELSRSSGVLFRRDRQVLVEHVLALMDMEALPARVGADRARLGQFVEEASKRYRQNPYHNWKHATDITHCIAWLVSRPVFSRYFQSVDKFWLLIAAISHGLDHPGHTLIQDDGEESRPLLVRRSDSTSTLLALQTLRELMARPECDFASTMAEEDQLRGAVLLGELVRATEYGDYGAFAAEFTEPAERDSNSIENPDASMQISALKMLMKAASISHTTQPFGEAHRWARRMMEEFWAQGRREKALGIAASKMNDETRTSLEQAQIQLIESTVLPLLKQLSRLDSAVEAMEDTAKDNLAQYRERAAGILRST